jgi:hypothetical protein
MDTDALEYRSLLFDISRYLDRFKATIDNISNINNEFSEFIIHCAFNHTITTTYYKLQNQPILCHQCIVDRKAHIEDINQNLIKEGICLTAIDINQYQIVTLKCANNHTIKHDKDTIPKICPMCDYYKDSLIWTQKTSQVPSWYLEESESENSDSDVLLPDFKKSCEDNESMVDYSMEPIEYNEVDPEFDARDEIEFFQNTPNHDIEEIEQAAKMAHYFNQLQKQIQHQYDNEEFKHISNYESNIELQHKNSFQNIEYNPNPPKPHINRDSNININTELIDSKVTEFQLPENNNEHTSQLSESTLTTSNMNQKSILPICMSSKT